MTLLDEVRSRNATAVAAVVVSAHVLVVAAQAGLFSQLTLVLASIALVLVVVARPAVGGALLAMAVASNASSVLTAFHGVPSITEPLLLVVAGAVALRSWRTRRAPSYPSPSLVLVLAAYATIQLVSTLWALDRYAATEAATSTMRDIVIAMVVVTTIEHSADLRLVLLSLVAVGAALGALAVIQVTRGDYSTVFGGFAQASVEQIVGAIDGWRIKGPFDDPNYFAQAMVIMFGLSLGYTIAGRRPGVRLLAAASALTTGLAVLFSYSRGGMIGMVAVLAASILIRRPPPRLVLTLLLFGVLAATILPSSYVERVTESSQGIPVIGGGDRIADSAVRGRTSEALVGLDMFLDHPLAGVGVANYPTHYLDYSLVIGLDPRREDRQPHNLALQIASETGLIGLASFGAVLGLALSGLRRARRAVASTDLGTMLTLAWVGFLPTSIFLHSAYGGSMWLLVALSVTAGGLATPMRPGPTAPVADLDIEEYAA